ncbi:MAG: hypothetical protein JNK48_14030 [Bryobacterales bacterium]|nr:hypothetical protein [Bryobacterales bacterium]
MTYPYKVRLPKGMTLVVELAGRPVDFEIIFPGNSGKVVFSRAADSDPKTKGTVDRDSQGKAHLSAPEPVMADPGFLRIEKNGESASFVEYSDPEMP